MKYLLAIPATIAAAYWLLALVAGILRRFARAVEPLVLPPVSILKPIHGRDPGLYDALRSHATLDYPEFEILIGFNDPNDAAIEDARKLAQEFPERGVRILEAATDAPNGKVGVLAHLAAEARYGVLLVNDSDITVDPGYLRGIIGPLNDPRVGLVTCLYRAHSEHWPGRFEALGIATDFAPSVLVSRLIGISNFALGSTMLFRARELARIGGFQAIAHHIADDYELGLRIAALGYRIHLSNIAVQTELEGRTWRGIWRHQVRWARTIRSSQPAGYAGTIMTHATLWSAVALGVGAWPVASVAMALRILAGWVVGAGVVRDGSALWLAPLIPFRDLWGAAVWAAGLAGDTVEWRGKLMRLARDGRIEPL